MGHQTQGHQAVTGRSSTGLAFRIPEFQANTPYLTGDLIREGGTPYIRNSDGTSGASFAADAANWDSTDAQLRIPDWQPSTVYAPNDTVYSDGKVLRSNSSRTSQATMTYLEASAWDIVTSIPEGQSMSAGGSSILNTHANITVSGGAYIIDLPDASTLLRPVAAGDIIRFNNQNGTFEGYNISIRADVGVATIDGINQTVSLDNRSESSIEVVLVDPATSDYAIRRPVLMTGATSGADGTSGILPAPSAGDSDKLLMGDATYEVGHAAIMYNGTDGAWDADLGGTSGVPTPFISNVATSPEFPVGSGAHPTETGAFRLGPGKWRITCKIRGNGSSFPNQANFYINDFTGTTWALGTIDLNVAGVVDVNSSALSSSGLGYIVEVADGANFDFGISQTSQAVDYDMTNSYLMMEYLGPVV